jgi:predicted nucleic acid-binding protein
MPSGIEGVGFVVDASATLPWCFEDEATPEAEGLLERLRAGEPALVPSHWPTEVMNGLIMAARRGRIDPERVTRFAHDLAALPIRIEPPQTPASWDAVIRVATEHQLTAYDAAYLELAERTSLPLASLDGDLRKAALAAGVALLEA